MLFGATVFPMAITQHQINQRDLRTRSKDIMDAIEKGETFTITRNGREIAELVPVKKQRRFVLADDFLSASFAAPSIDANRWRADLDSVIDPLVSDSSGR